MFQKLGMPSRRLLLSATQFIFVSHRCSRCRSCKVAHGGKPCSLQHTACASWPGRIPRIYTLTNVFGYIKYIRHPGQNERKIKRLSACAPYAVLPFTKGKIDGFFVVGKGWQESIRDTSVTFQWLNFNYIYLKTWTFS
jgi:hypothetical protein